MSTLKVTKDMIYNLHESVIKLLDLNVEYSIDKSIIKSLLDKKRIYN